MPQHPAPARQRACAALIATALLCLPGAAQAHSFGKLYNLPVPFWLYVYGAAAALLVSFLVVAYFVTAHPTQAGASNSRDIGNTAWMRTLRRWRVPALLKVLSLGSLLLCVLTGLFGARNPYTNINMTLFWILFVLVFTYLSALFGEVYAAINPWRRLAQGIGRLWPAYLQGRYHYPNKLAWWPALLLYMTFIWIELFGYTRPYSLAVILLAYSAINLAGVWLVGITAWFRYGEFFGVFLHLVAKMAPLDYRPEEKDAARLHLRIPFSSLLDDSPTHASLMLFVLFMLSSTAFDGLHDTAPWMRWFWIDLYGWLKPVVGDNPLAAYPILRPWYTAWATLCLLASPFLYLAVYLLFIRLSKLAAGSELPTRELALRFAYTLLPIALVYNVTHYYTLILSQGSKIVSLVSDPFGIGWNLFGTAYWLRAPIIPNAGIVWHTQVGLIVFGHIVSVYLAHLQALRCFPNRRQATLSQMPMLLLMVLFTTFGLWILAQPIRSGG